MPSNAATFFAEDITSEPPQSIKIEITKGPQRVGYQHRRGGFDEKYHLTLLPNSPVTVSCPFNLVRRTQRHAGESESEPRPLFQPKHRYRLGISDSGAVGLWWWGTCDDVLDEEEGPSKDQEREALKGRGPIKVAAEPVEFSIDE